MMLLLFVLAGVALGAAIAAALFAARGARPYSHEPAALLDSIAATAILSLAVWVSTSWALAWVGLLRPWPLTFAAAVELVAATVWLARRRRGAGKTYPLGSPTVLAGTAIVLAPIVLWTAFVAWRGTVLPVYNHDALSYHMTKAVLLVKSGRFQIFDVPEERTASFPFNYELLLADTMTLTGGDEMCAAVSTFSYVVLAILAARIAAAFWGGGLHVTLAAAFAATAPVVILHSGLHKNDLLLAIFAVAAIAWSARWFATGCLASLVLGALSLLLAAGTKLDSAFVAAGAGTVLALGAWRHRAKLRWGQVAWFVAASAAASLVLGCATYIVNLATFHRVVLVPSAILPKPYGDWFALWQFTTMLVIAPFSPVQGAVWNPFRGAWWWWPANDISMSNFGALFSVLALLLLPCVLFARRRAHSPAEAAAAGLSALAAYLLTLPIPTRPIGFFSSSVRYLIFILPFLAAWTLCPLVIAAERLAGRGAGAVRIGLALAMGIYATSELRRFGLGDSYAPLEWVAYAFQHPEDRTPFVRRNRAANRFDAIAGPDEACAIDVSYDTWIYPAYGRGWTRRVEFLKRSEGPVEVPPDVDWVIVDRSWNVFFGHPKFVDMGHSEYLGRGRPSADDLKVYRQLTKDPAFELVYDDRTQNQALFHRRRQNEP